MIDTDPHVAGLVARLDGAPWVAVDTEADSLHAYPEKLCLLQISIPDLDELVDPLARINLSPVLQALGQHELIMHGADYDLRLLRKHHDFVPRAVFDTMLAARLLGVTMFGLTNLVSQYLNVTLEKGSQKADWARRPLTPRMEDYARNDTRYLKPVADQLRAALEARGRLEWHREMCARLVVECSVIQPSEPDTAWRIKGSHKLSRPALAVLREIWEWREKEALAANRPPFFILAHESLANIAAAAADGQPFDSLLPRRFPDRRRLGVTRAVQAGLSVPPDQQPQPVRHSFERISDAVKRRVNELQQIRDARAAKLEIDPTLIASRATLLDLARDWNTHFPSLMNWQKELLSKPAD